MMIDRRRFLLCLSSSLACGGALTWRFTSGRGSIPRDVRPPGALPEADFLATCVRCGQCISACPRGCILRYPLADGPTMAGVPYVDPRRRACDLCMRCTQVCPTGALRPIPEDKKIVSERVAMGRAIIDESLCISFLGRLCGLCLDACPFPGKAIKLGSWARPVVLADGCVGCGLCAEICPQRPSAIRIDPTKERSRG